MGLWGAIKAVFLFLLELLKGIAFVASKREREKPIRDLEKFDEALAKKDYNTISDMLSKQHDRMRKNGSNPR